MPATNRPGADPLLPRARRLVLCHRLPSVALLQRHLLIGYRRALGLMQALEGDIVTPPDQDGLRRLLPHAIEETRHTMDSTRPAAAADWHHEPLPPQHTTIRLNRMLSEQKMEAIRRGCIPEDMSDRWFVYAEGDTVYFHRSWTGYCVYVLRFVPHADAWGLAEADVNRDPAQYSETSDERDAERIGALIDSVLLHRAVSVPPGKREGRNP